MIIIEIQSVNMRYNNGKPTINVSFSGQDDPVSLAVSGVFPLTEEEYNENRSTEQLSELVRTKIIEKVQQGAPE